MESVIKPPRLKPGDKVGVVAPASPPLDMGAVRRGLETLEELGFQVELPQEITASVTFGYLAGPDSVRAEVFMRMVADPTIKGIICLRGGYGSGRLLRLIDYGLIRQHPKVLVGASDITALQCAIWKEVGLITFHGPMVCTDFARLASSHPSLQSFRRIVSGGGQGCIYSWAQEEVSGVCVLSHGRVKGRLVGGNLAVLCSLIGTPWFPDLKDKILFIEDVNEPLYRLDRMFTQLLESGSMGNVAGIIAGKFEASEETRAESSVTRIVELLHDRFGMLGVPLVVGIPFGHILDKITIPFGVLAELDTSSRRLVLLEPPTE